MLRQRPGVHPDPDRRAGGLRALDHLSSFLRPADVARVQPHAMRTRIDRLQRQRMVEVDVGNHGDRRLDHDPAQRVHVLLARDGAAHQVAARVGDRADLAHRRVVVGRLGLRHRLDGDGRAASDEHASDVDLALRGHGLKGTGGVPVAIRVSIESVMSRIAAIQGGFAAPAAAPAAAPQAGTAAITAAGPGATSFASSLQSAMGGPAGQTFQAASPGTYPHLDGDLDSNPELLRRLEALAAQRGEHFHITSGGRTYAEQDRLWNARGSNPYPAAHPGTSRHESGNAADVTINGSAIQTVISAQELHAAGISPLAGDAVHVELPS